MMGKQEARVLIGTPGQPVYFLYRDQLTAPYAEGFADEQSASDRVLKFLPPSSVYASIVS